MQTTTATSKAKPFAVFDIDGTLVRWQLFHAIVDELGKQGHVPKKAYQDILRARATWRQRRHSSSFKDYEFELVKAYNQAVKGLKVSSFMTAVEQVFAEYRDQVYVYTRDLITDLKAKNYLIFAISGSQIEVVQLLADYYGFDDFAGSEYKQRNGTFTGEEHVMRSNNKLAALQRMIQTHGASQTGSIAIGDTESDIPILEQVAKPIVFNPTKALYDHATVHHWPIVVERKNVIYKLEAGNGSYFLA